MASAAARLAMATAAAAMASSVLAQSPDQTFRQRPPQDEVIYFLLPDRFANGDADNDDGGYGPDPQVSGFDPANPEFYHGGDLAGVIQQLDYIQGLGATAVWLAPVFKNKPVQPTVGRLMAGAHGYWITDFTRPDPHFGESETMKALVEAAHARGMKVYLDIVTNHTADVIQYRECSTGECVYRSVADYPWTRRGGVDGAPINEGFRGDGGAEDFARLTEPTWAYTPYVPAGEEDVKVPAWLNDPRLYHNRGDSTFRGESSTFGDFAGLDDLFTENPRVVQGMIEIFGDWIDEYGVDGFRIDTAKHVNPEFWQAFVPAMLERARARGIPNFHIFGEVYDHDPAVLARHTRVDGLPAVLDFAFQSVATDVANGVKAPDALQRLFDADALYEGGAEAALQLPTFLGNHDMGRIGSFVLKAHPNPDDDELLARTTLAHALMMFSRGVPTLYYGDEQGFAGEGGYGGARQDMWESQVEAYRSERRIGGARAPYDRDAPLYRRIAEMARLRADNPALRGGLQIGRAAAEAPGLFAFSRRLDDQPGETLVLFNTGVTPLTANVSVDPASQRWTASRGACPAASAAPGVVRVTLAPLDYMVCVSESPAQ
ncbi:MULTISPECIES: alpha-amylase family glycosyl hydrolase [unclassified Brevundimonas]|uniref:alpha-amylase family glycosyl hydrolase n=1 Tax=unclassified Brevundimonas TaxID=2622653 RepID=UPI001430366D|nr:MULTISPECIES: alpha-amylase family glycosyl hydrolase [unclassified Brevundimonas]